MSDEPTDQFSEREALLFHSEGRPGKIEIIASKPMATQRDLALAYSPGVAVPVLAIAEDPATAYDYTAKGNLVAVISNGTAILGLGNLGALASAGDGGQGGPVQALRRCRLDRYRAEDRGCRPDDRRDRADGAELRRHQSGRHQGAECFIIEQTLRERMNIPVFHDDQHGTAIICAAGLINACLLTNRRLDEIKVVVNGAGAAAIACTELMKAMGVRHDNVIMCDRTGVIYQGRDDINQWQSAHAAVTDRRSLTEALHGADVFLGLSAAGALKPEMVRTWRLADHLRDGQSRAGNPPRTGQGGAPRRDRRDRPFGLSEPGQQRHRLPFIFRGALDVRATGINDEMKIAAANAIAELARQRVPEEVALAYGTQHTFGPEYIIPAPFDPRLMELVPRRWRRRRWTRAWRRGRSSTWTPIARSCARA